MSNCSRTGLANSLSEESHAAATIKIDSSPAAVESKILDAIAKTETQNLGVEKMKLSKDSTLSYRKYDDDDEEDGELSICERIFLLRNFSAHK